MTAGNAPMGSAAEAAAIERRVERLANERAALFSRSGAAFGLVAADQTRLKAIERELDELFVERRQHRAVRDARRFKP